MGLIKITGKIGEDVTVKSVRRELAAMRPGEPVIALIDSNGGALRDGLDLGELLAERAHTVLVKKAHSAAALIACHHHRVGIYRDGVMSVHQPYWSGGRQQAASLQASQRNATKVFAEVLARKVDSTVKLAKAMLIMERCFNSRTAVGAGLADFVM